MNSIKEIMLIDMMDTITILFWLIGGLITVYVVLKIIQILESMEKEK